MLILCGSSMSYMEDHVLSYKAPLYGRRTSQMKLAPFDFADTCRCFTRFSGEDKALLYGIVGGTPQYLLQMDDRCSIADNRWGTDPLTRSQTEIDIMGEQDQDTALFGECKWTNDKVDTGVLETLDKRSRIFHYHKTQLYLFAKNGFTKGCAEAAGRMGNVTLVTYQDILKKMTE